MENHTAQGVFDSAFPAGRAPRSPAYKQGVLDTLRAHIDKAPLANCPYATGTAEADAYFAGAVEALALVKARSAQRR